MAVNGEAFTPAQIAAIAAGSAPVQSVNGHVGAVNLAFGDMSDAVSVAAGFATASGLSSANSSIAGLQTTVSGYGNIVTHNTSEFATSGQIATANANIATNSSNITTNTASISSLNTSVAGKANTVHTHVAADITDFTAAVVTASPVKTVAGRTGNVVIASGDVSGLSAAIDARIPADAVSSVAGRTGAVTLTASDVSGLTVAASAAAPVQSVAGKTGSVSLVSGDITNFIAAVDARIPAQAVTSVAGRTGAIVLAEADVTGLVADLAAKLTSVVATDTSITVTGSNSVKVTRPVNYYAGTTLRNGLKVFTTSVVISGGNAVFQLTDTLLSGGTARFANVDITSAQLSVFSTTALYFFSLPVLSNGGKTLTVGVTQLSSVLGILTLATAANGLTCNLTISGD